MNNVNISVIIPVYNSSKYIHECLYSVCGQTLKNIEIICINDGSTDNSEEIIKKFCLKDKRVKLINQKNSGASEARKKGIEIASGEYVSFIDSDDFVKENFLEILYYTACKYDSCIAVTSDVVTFCEKNIFSSKKTSIESNKENLDIYERCKLFTTIGSACNKIYKKEFCKSILKYYISYDCPAEDMPLSIFSTILAKKYQLLTMLDIFIGNINILHVI